MANNEILGWVAYSVMAAIARLKDKSGTSIAAGEIVREEIELATKKPTAIGTVWAALERLEKAGLLKSEVSDRDGRRPKRFYELTESGLKALVESRQAIDSMVEGLEFGAGKRSSLKLEANASTSKRNKKRDGRAAKEQR